MKNININTAKNILENYDEILLSGELSTLKEINKIFEMVLSLDASDTAIELAKQIAQAKKENDALRFNYDLWDMFFDILDDIQYDNTERLNSLRSELEEIRYENALEEL